jgi:hypothetical protein
MSEATVLLNRETEIRLPMTPNFINGVPIASFTDLELRRIGEAWTDHLIERARDKRRRR